MGLIFSILKAMHCHIYPEHGFILISITKVYLNFFITLRNKARTPEMQDQPELPCMPIFFFSIKSNMFYGNRVKLFSPGFPRRYIDHVSFKLRIQPASPSLVLRLKACQRSRNVLYPPSPFPTPPPPYTAAPFPKYMITSEPLYSHELMHLDLGEHLRVTSYAGFQLSHWITIVYFNRFCNVII